MFLSRVRRRHASFRSASIHRARPLALGFGLEAVGVPQTAAVGELLAGLLLVVEVPHPEARPARARGDRQVAPSRPGRLHALVATRVRVQESVVVSAAAARPPEL